MKTLMRCFVVFAVLAGDSLHALQANPPPQWSSDGSRMLVISYGDLHIFDSAGNKLRQLAIGAQPTDVYLAPDGSKIAYVLRGQEIWILDVGSGSKMQVFSPGAAESCGEIRWVPNGSALVYSIFNAQNGSTQGGLYIVQADGSGKKLILNFKP